MEEKYGAINRRILIEKNAKKEVTITIYLKKLRKNNLIVQIISWLYGMEKTKGLSIHTLNLKNSLMKQ